MDHQNERKNGGKHNYKRDNGTERGSAKELVPAHLHPETQPTTARTHTHQHTHTGTPEVVELVPAQNHDVPRILTTGSTSDRNGIKNHSGERGGGGRDQVGGDQLAVTCQVVACRSAGLI